MDIIRIVEITLSIILLLLFPFLFAGIINRVKSFWAGRKGPRLLQPLYDFIKLFRKGEVISKTTSFVFRISPVIIFSAILTAGLFVPIINNRSVFGFDGDFILFGYLFAISRFFSIINAMDTGSSFEGMGASREATFSALAEPAFFMIISSMCLISGNTSFEKIFADIFSLIQHSGWISFLIIILTCGTLFIMLLLEGCRVPIDDPNTHLELTMIHEVMILDNSGPDLALLIYGSYMKMFIVGSLIANLIIPYTMGIVYSIPLFILVQFVLAITIGCIESLLARFRMSHIPQYLFIMNSIGLIVLSAILVFNLWRG